MSYYSPRPPMDDFQYQQQQQQQQQPARPRRMVRQYRNEKEYQRELPLMTQDGWAPISVVGGSKRVTATRWLLAGPLALAWKKGGSLTVTWEK